MAGVRLDRFIQTRIPRLSRTRANQIVRACAYREDGRRRRPSERVRAGEIVLLVRPTFDEPITPTSFRVIFEDEAMLVVDKPAGLPVHPSASYHKNTLTYLLRQRFPDKTPQIAHRLDRETSGLLICAKTLDDERALKGSFERREVKKTYLAISEGLIEPDDGLIEQPIGRPDEGLHLLMEVREDKRGSPAETAFRVDDRRQDRTLVALFPRTGRQHQLRVHLASIGHPIVGDKLYGPEGAEPFLEYCETGMTDALLARLRHPRQALHAHRLELPHPRSGKPQLLESPLAPDLVELWER